MKTLSTVVSAHTVVDGRQKKDGQRYCTKPRSASPVPLRSPPCIQLKHANAERRQGSWTRCGQARKSRQEDRGFAPQIPCRSEGRSVAETGRGSGEAVGRKAESLPCRATLFCAHRWTTVSHNVGRETVGKRRGARCACHRRTKSG